MNKRRLVFRLALSSLLAAANALADATVLSVSAVAQSPDPVCRGGEAALAVTVTRKGSGNLEANLSAADLPAGVTATFAPNPVKFGSNNETETSTLTLSTAGSMPPWNYSWRLIASGGGSHNTITNTATLNVTMCSPGVALAPDGTVWLAFGGMPGESCRIEATTNLVSPQWTTLCQTNLDANGLLVMYDLDSKIYPTRFYRMVMP